MKTLILSLVGRLAAECEATELLACQAEGAAREYLYECRDAQAGRYNRLRDWAEARYPGH